MAQRTIDGKNIHFREKGGIPWEIKAGKKTKTKRKSRKPSNRKKRTKRNKETASSREVVGFAWAKPTNPETL